MRGLLNRSRFWLFTMMAGGSLFVLEGCDPNVRDTILAGVESSATLLFTTFVQAFFESLTADEGTLSTVKAVIEHVPQYFA
ncbi:MAG: hypothetical protein KKB50_20445 [Planctomycetes bacterium]|nr:hypothetical protein [Planctomycetota bacterium]